MRESWRDWLRRNRGEIFGFSSLVIVIGLIVFEGYLTWKLLL